jgi:hypothetical protein
MIHQGTMIAQEGRSWFNLNPLYVKVAEVKISIRSSKSEKIFHEKKKFDDLWAHYHIIVLADTY